MPTTARRPPPDLRPCPCGAGRPVTKLNARRHSFDRSLWCPKCTLQAGESRSAWMRAVLWNQRVLSTQARSAKGG